MICEWNPQTNDLNMTRDENHRVPATHVVYRGDERLRLCAACSTLPEFRKWKRLERSEEGVCLS
jgi:hypothetical protein